MYDTVSPSSHPDTHSELYSVSCPLCGSPRPRDPQQPCGNCGSRNHRLIGYVFPHEAKSFFLMAGIALGAVLLALIMAAAYFYYVNVVLGV